MKTIGVMALYAALTTSALAQNTFGDAQRTPPPQQQQAPPQQQQAPPQQQQPQYPQQQPQQYPQQQPQQQQPQRQQNNTRPQPQQQQGFTAAEQQDFGVQATQQLHSGPMHGETPISIPGGQLISTQRLNALVSSKQTPFVMLDVLGSGDMLPGAVQASWASQAGSFNDQIQQQFGQMLQQVTRGNKQTPLVLYCLSPHCWMSYNAALRAINLGYSNVLWYRGGVESWKSAGLQTSGSGNQFGGGGNGGFGGGGG